MGLATKIGTEYPIRVSIVFSYVNEVKMLFTCTEATMAYTVLFQKVWFHGQKENITANNIQSDSSVN